jgi:hypothetical protein
VRDLASVQSLSPALMCYDAVTFLQHLEGLRLSEGGSSIWLYHEATHVIYEQVQCANLLQLRSTTSDRDHDMVQTATAMLALCTFLFI